MIRGLSPSPVAPRWRAKRAPRGEVPDEPAWPADGTRRNMPSLTTMGTESANIRCEGLLVVIASSWTKHRRRWFVLDGYHVAFYKTRELTVRRGRFDLRHVLRIEPSRLAGRDVASASRVVPAWRHSCSPPCRTLGWHWPAARCAFRAGGAAGTQTPNERPRLGCQAGPKPLAVHALSTPPLHATGPRRGDTSGRGAAAGRARHARRGRLRRRRRRAPVARSVVLGLRPCSGDASRWKPPLWQRHTSAALLLVASYHPSRERHSLAVRPLRTDPMGLGCSLHLVRRARDTQIARRGCGATVSTHAKARGFRGVNTHPGGTHAHSKPKPDRYPKPTPGGPTATHTPARGAQRAAWCVVLGAGHTAHPIGSMYATHS